MTILPKKHRESSALQSPADSQQEGGHSHSHGHGHNSSHPGHLHVHNHHGHGHQHSLADSGPPEEEGSSSSNSSRSNLAVNAGGSSGGGSGGGAGNAVNGGVVSHGMGLGHAAADCGAGGTGASSRGGENLAEVSSWSHLPSRLHETVSGLGGAVPVVGSNGAASEHRHLVNSVGGSPSGNASVGLSGTSSSKRRRDRKGGLPSTGKRLKSLLLSVDPDHTAETAATTAGKCSSSPTTPAGGGGGGGGGPSSSSSSSTCSPSASALPSAPPSSSSSLHSSAAPTRTADGNHPPLDSSPSGYNSEDEYSHLGIELTEEEWLQKDRRFERAMKKKGYIIKMMVEDGSCLFRAVADQIYGDQEMHVAVRNHCMNYISQNSDYFGNYVTEDINDYVERKRYLGVHGNHLEIQALSEMYSRPIHIYCYSEEPINIFQTIQQSNSDKSVFPIRLCYHRECHYNSLVDPNKATVGVGLGLPGFSPGSADRNLVCQAVKASEEDLVEKAMLQDKIKATDWEATNEAIEEQIARESYLQWLRDNERRNAPVNKTDTANNSVTAATVTSGALRTTRHSTASPKASCSGGNIVKKPSSKQGSPRAGCSFDRDSPKPGSSHVPSSESTEPSSVPIFEHASFLSGQNSMMSQEEDWVSDPDILAQVLALSQQEYLDSFKKSSQDQE